MSTTRSSARGPGLPRRLAPRRVAPATFSAAMVSAAALTVHAATIPLAGAADLPPHGPLRILVIGDEVNPHGLSASDLTQPGDIRDALGAADSGLSLAGPVALVDSQCVDDALTALGGAAPPEVVVYFAHQPARACAGGDRQPALTAALETFLEGGGGVVAYHHGLYVASGKEAVLQLLGAAGSGFPVYDTTAGQRIFDVAPGHFVTTNGITYPSSGPLLGAGAVPSGVFAYFDDVPDERYPNMSLREAAGETREILFATDSSGPQVLGYTLSRPGWAGRVVAFQPAEYQPNALDDRDGIPFQIFANAIVYAAHEEPAAPELDAGAPSSDAGTASADAGQAETDGGGVPRLDGGVAAVDGGARMDGGTSGPRAETGCGCRAGSARSGWSASGLVCLALALGAWRRRRRRS